MKDYTVAINRDNCTCCSRKMTILHPFRVEIGTKVVKTIYLCEYCINLYKKVLKKEKEDG